MKKASIQYNIIFNVILTLSNIIFPLVTFPYVSRILNPSGMGVVNFYSSIGNYAILIATLGISTYGIRVVASVREDKSKLTKVVQELTLINVLMAILVASLLLVSVLFVDKFQSEIGLVLITAISIVTSAFSLNWLYSGLEQYDYITKRSILFKVISLVLIFILVRKPSDYILYAGITLFSSLGSNILNVFYSRKFISFVPTKGLTFRPHIKPMLYLFASMLAVNVYTNLDAVMLGFISGDVAVGLYSVASKMKWLLLMLITSASAVLLPRLTYHLSKKESHQFNKILSESSALILLIAVPLSVYFIFMARDSVLLLGGDNYVDATTCMQILMPILIISGFSNITGNQILIPHNKDKLFMIAVSVGACVNLILNALLMPPYGIVGAAIATLVAEATQMAIQYYYSKEYLRGQISYVVIRNIVLSVVSASATMCLIIGTLHFAPLVNLVLSASLFFGVYLVVLIVLREENILRFLKKAKV
ncbi:flippase [uncultured Abiotrophia sp.]|uniref:flippase n=1 Tax=uncultured Abiotrophia sp. TaxID=316094 RepID=UPI0026244096|nr:flippase [uncultured Abiotrophia sp.]